VSPEAIAGQDHFALELSGFEENKRVSICEVLDRALNKGVVLWGDATISVAGVDLIYVGLKVLLASVDTAERLRQDAGEMARADAGAAE